MPRQPSPWYWKARDGWYICRDGRHHLLAKGKGSKAEALRAFHKLMASEKAARPADAPPTLGAVVDAFLDHCERHRAPLTMEWYRRHLGGFCRHVKGTVEAESVRPHHVNRWLDSHRWSDSTRHQAITACKAALEWARKQGLIAANPLKDMEKPGIAAREKVATPEQADAILAAVADAPFRDLLEALRETGARPSEMMRLEAAHLDLPNGRIVMPGKTTRKTRKPRIIYLTPAAIALFARLAVARPTGPLLLNRLGNPWTRHAIAWRFGRLRPKIGMGKEATAESFRHLYGTDALERGVPVATVAELMGHQSTAMVERHYGHLHARHEHLRAAASKARSALDEPEGTTRDGVDAGGDAGGPGAGGA